MLTRYDYFYDQQIKRYLLQVVRAFSGFQYMTGRRGEIDPQLKRVPCTMAKRNRQVAMIQRNASENVLNTVPMITVDLANFQYDGDRLQNPNHVGHVQVYERKRDPLTGQLTEEIGRSMTVQRLMPRPFLMTCQIDIWTSNWDQKFQLIEQIGEVIYPTFDIQNSDNAIDWSAITTAHPKDLTWTSVSVPVGAGEEIDIATITLEIPMWLSPPAKVQRQAIIEQIYTNINQAVEDEDGNLLNGPLLAQEVTTPGDHCLKVDQGFITLLGPKTNTVNAEGDPYLWSEFFYMYGHKLEDGVTQVRLRTSTEDNAPEIIGTLTATSNPSVLDLQIDVDTLPANSLPAITAVIDPLYSVPGDDLPAVATGQRYLIQRNALPGNTVAWGSVSAPEGAIIQWDGSAWQVVFDPLTETTQHFVLNSQSGKQLHWTGEQWAVAVEGIYHPAIGV